MHFPEFGDVFCCFVSLSPNCLHLLGIVIISLWLISCQLLQLNEAEWPHCGRSNLLSSCRVISRQVSDDLCWRLPWKQPTGLSDILIMTQNRPLHRMIQEQVSASSETRHFYRQRLKTWLWDVEWNGRDLFLPFHLAQKVNYSRRTWVTDAAVQRLVTLFIYLFILLSRFYVYPSEQENLKRSVICPSESVWFVYWHSGYWLPPISLSLIHPSSSLSKHTEFVHTDPLWISSSRHFHNTLAHY